VESLAARPEECARSPGRDFVRNRRLGLARLLLLLVCWGRDCAYAELCVTVNYKYANSTNPTHHFHQRSFANSANAYPPILAPARASSGTSGSRSFIL
jgi:hypothetical protein